jgi:hypothetical protein
MGDPTRHGAYWPIVSSKREEPYAPSNVPCALLAHENVGRLRAGSAMPELGAGLLTAILLQSGDATITASTAGVVRLESGSYVTLRLFAQEVAGASMDLIIPEELRAARLGWIPTSNANGRDTPQRSSKDSPRNAQVRCSAIRRNDVRSCGTRRRHCLGCVAVPDATERYKQARAPRVSPAT